MSRSLSFVIPVLNEGARIGGQLDYLRRAYPQAELIVVDGGSEDESIAEAMPRCDGLLLSTPGRARQMNIGAAAAAGDYLFFLHADTRPLVSGDELDRSLDDSPAWGFSRVRLSGSRPALRLIEWGMNQRSARTGVATGDQMLYLHRDLFRATGGFLAKIFDVQSRKFTTVTCQRCHYVEIYRADTSMLGNIFDFFTN